MRNVLVLMLVIGLGAGIFAYRRGATGDEVKKQMLLIVDDMDLAEQEREEVKPLVAQFHKQVFHQTLDISKQHGRKFDEKSYYDKLFSLVVGQLRDEGRSSLADKIERQQAFHSLTVTER